MEGGCVRAHADVLQPQQVLRHRLAVLIRLRALAQHGREFPGYFGIALKIRPN
jgi:hypothetical protein